MRRKSFYDDDLLNPVRATQLTADTFDTNELEKAEVFTVTKLRQQAILELKSEKGAGEDETRSKMLKALNGEGVH